MVVRAVKASRLGTDVQPTRLGCTMPPAGDRRSAVVLTTIVGLWLSLVITALRIGGAPSGRLRLALSESC